MIYIYVHLVTKSPQFSNLSLPPKKYHFTHSLFFVLVFSRYIETISTSIFLRLERDILKPVQRDEFVQWAYERFKESKTMATSEALLALYKSQH